MFKIENAVASIHQISISWCCFCWINGMNSSWKFVLVFFSTNHSIISFNHLVISKHYSLTFDNIPAESHFQKLSLILSDLLLSHVLIHNFEWKQILLHYFRWNVFRILFFQRFLDKKNRKFLSFSQILVYIEWIGWNAERLEPKYKKNYQLLSNLPPNKPAEKIKEQQHPSPTAALMTNCRSSTHWSPKKLKIWENLNR